MAGKRRKYAVDYAQLDVFSSVVMFDTAPKKKGKFYEVERVIQRRKTSKDYEYLLKWIGYPLDSCTWEPSHNLKPDLLTSYKNPPKPTSERLECASRDFLSGMVSALKGKCMAPVYISMALDVWRYIVHNKGKASQHKGFMLYEKDDFKRFETLPFHWHYYVLKCAWGRQCCGFPHKNQTCTLLDSFPLYFRYWEHIAGGTKDAS